MSTPHRATEEQWEMQGEWANIFESRLASGTARCLLELRSRVEALERRCKDEPPTLQEAQANKVHHEAELAGLEAWRRQHLIQAREVVAGQAEPEPLTTDEELYRTYMLDTGPDTVVDGLRAVYDLGRQHGARAAATEADNATAATVAEIRSSLFKDAAPDAPAVKDSLTAAPAGSLVERVAGRLSAACGLQDGQWDEAAIDVIREVADWFRNEIDYSGTAAVLEQEAAQPESAPDAPAAPARSLVEQMLDAMDQHLESNRYAEARAALRVVAAWLRENDSEREMGGDAAATADLIEYEAFR